MYVEVLGTTTCVYIWINDKNKDKISTNIMRTTYEKEECSTNLGHPFAKNVTNDKRRRDEL